MQGHPVCGQMPKATFFFKLLNEPNFTQSTAIQQLGCENGSIFTFSENAPN